MDRFESGVRLIIAFNEAFNRHDVAGMMAMMSDDCVFENTDPAPDGTVYKGKAAVTQFWQEFFIQSPEAHIKIEEALGFGNRVVMLWRYDWVDEAGEKGHVRGVDIFRVQNGLISEKLSYVKG
jgi:predicted SnoaL-like aldol condensation-catalyzing enzyme